MTTPSSKTWETWCPLRRPYKNTAVATLCARHRRSLAGRQCWASSAERIKSRLDDDDDRHDAKGRPALPRQLRKMALWGKVHADTPADMIVSLLKTICSEPPSAVFSVIGHFTPQRAANSPFAASADAVAPYLRGLRTAAEKTEHGSRHAASVRPRSLSSAARCLVLTSRVSASLRGIRFTIASRWRRSRAITCISIR